MVLRSRDAREVRRQHFPVGPAQPRQGGAMRPGIPPPVLGDGDAPVEQGLDAAHRAGAPGDLDGAALLAALEG